VNRTPGLLLLACALAACTETIDAGGTVVDAGVETDPLLSIGDPVEPGSLDDLFQTVIAQRCSGQPGLCHNGQFEPNLSTPALTYAYLVNRPALEKPDLLRVDPGNPEASLLIDKLRGREVATIMPLGANPLSEEEIRLIEEWIEDGALREPGAAPAPALNNPPAPPQLAIFDAAGNRLDDTPGIVRVAVGTTVVVRHTVRDFETADQDIPFAGLSLTLLDGRQVVLNPDSAEDPGLAQTTYDAQGPIEAGDALNYRYEFTIPATVSLYDEVTGEITEEPAAGLTLRPVSVYVDEFPGGIITFGISQNLIEVE
jgi:hypothetical protein